MSIELQNNCSDTIALPSPTRKFADIFRTLARQGEEIIKSFLIIHEMGFIYACLYFLMIIYNKTTPALM
jgi:hypothetical protein